MKKRKSILELREVPVDSLRPYERNPRKNDAVVDRMVGAIKEYGFRIPIVAKSDGTVVDGHLRLKAAVKLGMATVPVALADDLTDSQIKAFRILANQSANWAEWDLGLLKVELQELQVLDVDIDALGFSDGFVEDLLQPSEHLSAIPTGADKLPEVSESTRSRLGDVWILGDHRLMCGNSLHRDDVEELISTDKIAMIFTDPPYGMGLDTDYSRMNSNLKFMREKGSTGGKNYPSRMVDAFSPEILEVIFSLPVDEVFLWGADYYSEYLQGKNEGSWFVWDKRSNGTEEDSAVVSADKMLGSCFELCWSKKRHRREMVRIKWAGMFGVEQEPDRCRVHPTQKPVSLAQWFIERFTKTNDIILDLFGGSGSTMIACEQTNRKCRMMELDPMYVDVIIRRWQNITGKAAIHASTGEVFGAD